MSNVNQISDTYIGLLKSIYLIPKPNSKSNQNTYKKNLKEKLQDSSNESDLFFLDSANPLQNTILHITVLDSQIDLAENLLEIYEETKNKDDFKSWLTKENSINMTALDLAVSKDNDSLVKLFYSYYEKHSIPLIFKENSNNYFHLMSMNNNFGLIIYFVQKFGNVKSNELINSKNNDGNTPLHLACEVNSNLSIDVLIDLKCLMNIRNNEGQTPLHLAVKYGDFFTVKSLILYGSDLDIQDNYHNTPFQIAQNENKNEIKNLLSPISIFEKYFCCKTKIKRLEKNNSYLYLRIYLIIIFIISTFFTVIQIIEEDVTPSTIIFLIILVYFLVFLISYFNFCFRYNRFENTQSDLEIDLFELHEKFECICLKCKVSIDKTTVHCLVCERCVKNFHHHCFWLNLCITADTFNYFKVLVLGLFLYQILVFCHYLTSNN